jgi:[ribosomal protein S5]-alanine N-acetyltransferase
VAVLSTPRLRVRPLEASDSAFIVSLLNDDAFIRNIGDRGVRSLEDAAGYISNGPGASYVRYGFGLCAVALAESGTPIGICGLLQRDQLPSPDLGFAFLPQYRSQGYAYEAASAVMADAHGRLGIPTVLAIVNPGNAASIRLLERLGFTFERMIRLGADAAPLKLFAAAVGQKSAVG